MKNMAGLHVCEIEECLSHRGSVLEGSKPGSWMITPPEGGTLPVYVYLVDDWLQLNMELGEESRDFWSALLWNGLLEGPSKFFFNLPQNSLSVRAEIPLHADINIAPDLSAALRGIETASALVRNDAPGNGAEVQSKTSCSSPLQDADTLQELLVENGWTLVQRSSGSLMVELESRGDFYQAALESSPDGRLRISVELINWEKPDPVSREALAALLLTASGAIRMVCPVVEQCNEEISARFEIRFASHPNSAQLGRGLSALSVACRHCGREANILNSKRIAERYLAVRGFTKKSSYRGGKPWRM